MSESENARFKLQITCGAASWDFLTNTDHFLVGRSQNCAVSLPISILSRKHLEISRDESGIWHVCDLGSSQGSSLDGNQMTPLRKYPFEFPLQVQIGKSIVLNVAMEITETEAAPIVLDEVREATLEAPPAEEHIQARPAERADDLAAEIRAEINQISNDLQKIKIEYDDIWRKREARREDLDAVEKTLLQKQNDLQKLLKEIENQKSLLDSLATEAKTRAEEIETATASHKKILESLAQTKVAAETARTEHEEISSRLAEIHDQRARSEAELNELEEKIVPLKIQVDELRQESRRFSAQAESAQALLTKTLQEQTSLEAQKLDLIKSHADLTERNAQAAKELQSVLKQIKDLESSVLEAQRRSEDAKDLAAQLSRQAESQRALASAADMKYTESRSTLEALRAELEVGTTKLKDLNARAERAALLGQDCEKLELTKTELQAQVASMANENREIRARHDAEIDVLRREGEGKLKAEFVTKAQSQENELARQKKLALDEIEAKRSEWQEQRDKQLPKAIKEIERASHDLFQAHFGKKMQENADIEPITKVFQKDLMELIKASLSSSSSNLKLDTHLKSMVAGVDVNRSAQKYWRHRGAQIGAAVAVLVLGFAFPAIPQGIYGGLRDAVTRKPASSSAFAESIRQARLNRPKFLPQQNKIPRDTYTDNLLYLEGYQELKTNEELRKKWTTDLNDFIQKELDMDDRVIVSYISFESVLLSELNNLGKNLELSTYLQKIDRMKDFEAIYTTRFTELLGSPENYKKVREFEAKFYTSNMSSVDSE